MKKSKTKELENLGSERSRLIRHKEEIKKYDWGREPGTQRVVDLAIAEADELTEKILEDKEYHREVFLERQEEFLLRNREFYLSREWREVRHEVLKNGRGKCELCGADSTVSILHVDHIVPRSKCPERELDISNLQVLCEECNIGKSNTDDTDWRKWNTSQEL